MAYPENLQRVVDYFARITDNQTRIQTLISYSKRFVEVTEDVAVRPFDQRHRVPECESDVYVWAIVDDNQNVTIHTAVENPEGLSAKAFAAVLQKGLKDATVDDIEKLDTELVYSIFGKQLSMGKNMGLTGMIQMIKAQTRQHLAG
ncbi:MAG: SufE family protein [Bacteroidetes bacterium]|nr:SufE family protein [Bacteroidota bacterium]MCH8524519.1 SufE family protein [Balneolales bacterium]